MPMSTAFGFLLQLVPTLPVNRSHLLSPLSGENSGANVSAFTRLDFMHKRAI